MEGVLSGNETIGDVNVMWFQDVELRSAFQLEGGGGGLIQLALIFTDKTELHLRVTRFKEDLARGI